LKTIRTRPVPSGNKYLEIELHVDHARVGRVILDYEGGSYTVRYEKSGGAPSA